MRIHQLPFLIIAFLFACTEPQQQETEKENTEQDALEAKATEPMKAHREKAFYPIPSPEQMLGFINDAGIDYSKDLIHDISKSNSFNNPTVKALNFGVYTADMAYAAAYQDIESTIDLYKVVKQMSADLNIEEMMSEERLKEVQANLQNNDSLAVIAGRSYYDAVEYLEDNGQEGKLALMSLGGWIESLYITLNAIKEFDENSETAMRIADQKITFGNLYTFMQRYEDRLGISDAMNNIHDIRAVFASLKETKGSKSVKKTEDGKLILGSGNHISISEAQFNKLKEAINEYRASITQNEKAA